MPRYQIEFKFKTEWVYVYFSAAKDIVYKGCGKANETLFKLKDIRPEFKPPKSLMVRELSTEGTRKKGGHRFKLKLSFLELRTISGKKYRDEWYQYKE